MSDWRAEFDAVVAPALARSASIAEIVIGEGAIAEAGALHRRHFGARPAIMIADENTMRAAGDRVAAELRRADIEVRAHVLPAAPRPKPTVELGEAIRAEAARDGAEIVAVGSGVLNDLAKYAAHRLDRPYWCVATAASMDGYASAGAPLSEKGFKKTIACRPPVAILADLEIVVAAPREMAGWGYADLAGKVPAGGDWIVADALGVEAIDDVAWPMVQDRLRRWLAAPDAVASGAAGATADLFTGLTVVGLAMEAHGSSRPASGADHQIAHLWEMEGLSFGGERVSHGACVAIGAVTALALFDWLLAQDLTRVDAARILDRAPSLDAKNVEIDAAFADAAVAERARVETAAKHLDRAAHAARLDRVAAAWPALRARLDAHLMSRDEMAALLVRAGAPTRAHQIGLTPERHRAATLAARFIRSRYTVLDLLDETGLLTTAVDAVFSEPFFRAA